ncbi:MAG: hypothetical protein ABIQ60_07685 [Burkholderiaceae bacterium]
MALNESLRARWAHVPEIDEAPLIYARLIEAGTRLGLLVLVVTFAAYLTGALQPRVPLERMPELWNLPVARFVELVDSPTGWGWVALWRHGDTLSMAGIAVLTGWSALPLLALLPVYRQRGDRVYFGLCVAHVAVLMLAASGLLVGGH